MKTDEITVEVKTKLTVDEETAETCLKLVELYLNQTCKVIAIYKTQDGDYKLEFRTGVM